MEEIGRKPAILPRRRPRAQVVGELEAHRHAYEQLVKETAHAAALFMGPIFVNVEDFTITRAEFEVPAALAEAIAEERTAIASLERELYEGRR